MSTHLRLLSFLKPYKKQVVFAWFVVAMTAITTMVMPQLRWAIDSGLKPSYAETGVSITRAVQPADDQIVVTSSSAFDVDQRIRLEDETAKITEIRGDTLTVDRGQNIDHPAGTAIRESNPSFSGETRTLMTVGVA